MEWMGESVLTLGDLLADGLRAVCVGINPSIVSVELGHYYQGPLGQRFFARLREAGLIPAAARGSEDDVAFAAGVGFSDIVKRPTRGSKEVSAREFAHGRSLLLPKLEKHRPPLVVFAYKKTAVELFGPFPGNGFLPGRHLAHSELFVMPGPYESAATAAKTLRTLAERLA